MTLWTLALRSLRFHARAHAGVLLGAAVGSAVLIGALLVGDSVRASLREMALQRLGKVEAAMATGDRLFTAALATNLGAAPVLALTGTANSADGSRRANRVHVLGVEEAFWRLAQTPPAFASVPPDAVVLNQPLAEQLGTKVGDDVLLRVTKVSALSQEVSLSPREGQAVALRLRVHAIASNAQLGRFSLQANQVAPFNAFVNLVQLQERVDALAKANLAVTGKVPRYAPNQVPWLREDATRLANYSLAWKWTLADAGLISRVDATNRYVELRSSRIFLDSSVVSSLKSALPDIPPQSVSAPLALTYLVNELRVGDRATPYSMVTATGRWPDDEIVINQWLADDLKAGPGAELALTYFRPDSGGRLVEATNRFRVRSIVPMQMSWADRTLMPDFPGIANAERAGDWDAGFPLVHKIRKEDDDYWQTWRGTPKAFVTLAAGERMWSNRFGSLTTMRFPLRTNAVTPAAAAVVIPPAEFAPSQFLKSDAPRDYVGGVLLPARPGVRWGRTPEKYAASTEGGVGNLTEVELAAVVRGTVKPASLGLVFQPVREQALAASAQSQDFGGLFIGFSFFLIVAALVLMALLFQFGVEQRATEVGTLLAFGFTPARVRRLLLLEGAALALLGGLLGMVGGIAYARAMLHGLTTIWRDAVGTSSLHYHASPMTLAIGSTAAVLVAVGTIWFALRKQVAQPARVLLSGENAECGMRNAESRSASTGAGGAAAEVARHSDVESGAAEAEKLAAGAKGRGGTRHRNVTLLGGTCLLLAFAMLGWALATGQTANAGAFFGAGALLLVASLAFTAALLSRLEGSEAAARLSLAGMGVRNATRRRRRSLATVAMLACGSFLIVSIGAFRLDENANATKRSAGTGGFAFLGESTLPVIHDLNSKSGREFFTLDEKELAGVDVVPFRVRDGDDASCLNLNRAQKPRLLGVQPELLAQRGAFSFAGVAKGLSKGTPWALLKRSHARESVGALKSQPPSHEGGYEIPGIADEASILWALGKKLGDTLNFVDERGQPFKVRLVASLANSILQGSIVIDHDEFVARFPNEAGYRMFLVDAPTNRAVEVSATLTRALRDVGLELTPATRRLAQLNAVQNTYLSTFQVLGGLGLLLGSVGLGVVVLRNVLERRGELALLLAVGLRPAALRALVLSEHGALLLLGLGCGVAAAAVAVLPALRSPGAEFPLVSLSLTLGAVLASGAVWTWAATRLALRGRLLDALRSE